MQKIAIFLSSLISTLPLPLFADDTAFGGSGAAPMPIEQPNVAMLNEHVIITGKDIIRDDFKGEWQYKCHYTFKNESDTPLSFQMGFPFPINEEDGNVTSPAGHILTKGGALVHDFVVQVDGKAITATQTKISPVAEKDLHYTHAYLWHITMQPKQTVKIDHQYITGVTFNVLGQNDVAFVLKTGGLWKGGVINSAILEVIPNTPTRLCIELNKKADYTKPMPAGMKIIGDKDRKYVWNLTNFKPRNDLQLCLVTAKNYVRYYVVHPVLYNTVDNFDLNKMTVDELRLLKNTIYAQYGRKFTDVKLQAYFKQQWWYQENQNYTDTMLTEDDKKAITIIVAKEQKLAEAKVNRVI